MSWQEFLEWIEYDALEPIGPPRGDWQAASICAAIMNGVAITARSRKRFRVKDFLLTWGGGSSTTKPKQTWQEQKFIARMFVAMSKSIKKR